jgi:hypothetical protein
VAEQFLDGADVYLVVKSAQQEREVATGDDEEGEVLMQTLFKKAIQLASVF